ncbi:hypothetical protein PSEUDO8BK_40711 [Pseudomonas sp. 8BK]|nr:hypothetical protein PSEUDO8BK_40711 [Pseudomonas sp. 8BK]
MAGSIFIFRSLHANIFYDTFIYKLDILRDFKPILRISSQQHFCVISYIVNRSSYVKFLDTNNNFSCQRSNI